MSGKYIAICKIQQNLFVKYHVNEVLNFIDFLDKKYPAWRFVNLYSNQKNDLNYRKQIANFTQQQRPNKNVY